MMNSVVTHSVGTGVPAEASIPRGAGEDPMEVLPIDATPAGCGGDGGLAGEDFQDRDEVFRRGRVCRICLDSGVTCQQSLISRIRTLASQREKSSGRAFRAAAMGAYGAVRARSGTDFRARSSHVPAPA